MALWPSSEDLASLSMSVLDIVVLVDDDLVLLEALLLLTIELPPGDSGVLPVDGVGIWLMADETGTWLINAIDEVVNGLGSWTVSGGAAGMGAWLVIEVIGGWVLEKCREDT